ncbi:uncharacterized protein LOC124179819 [Neodiprion fabricii]|uniref:uncharacterized protein LOC124179819 n=1 Tax=Neodiprion fabricii TaxID=2872261 RepID=UPI001ED8D5A8|nr:uncharacterized protein LOC124179819 [Neodiprion fabricii]
MNEETLILLIQPYTELYDMSDPKYSNQQRKDQCWEDIAKAMKETPEDCKLAWRRLRDSFRKAKKIRQSKSGAAASKKRPWRFEQQMAFLAPYMSERESRSNISEALSTPESQPSSIDEEPSNISDGDENDNDSSSMNNHNINASNTASCSSVTTESALFRKTAVKKDTVAISPPSDVAGVLLKYLQDKPKKTNEEAAGPINKFFSAMAETVKTFPKHFQVEVKSKVFQLVNDYEMRIVANTTNQAPHPLMPQFREQHYSTDNNHGHEQILGLPVSSTEIRRDYYSNHNTHDPSQILDYPPRNLQVVTGDSNMTDSLPSSSNFTFHNL